MVGQQAKMNTQPFSIEMNYKTLLLELDYTTRKLQRAKESAV